MNIWQANKIVRLIMRDDTKMREGILKMMYPDAHIRLPVPVMWFSTFADCVNFLSSVSSPIPTHEDRREFAVPHDENTTDKQAMANYCTAMLKAFAKQHNIDYTLSDGEIDSLQPGRRVVAAANRYGDLICVGARHGSPAMWSQLKAVKEDRLLEADKMGRAEEGFVDQWDVFMTREEAYDVAMESGQINTVRLKSAAFGKLHSEDIH